MALTLKDKLTFCSPWLIMWVYMSKPWIVLKPVYRIPKLQYLQLLLNFTKSLKRNNNEIACFCYMLNINVEFHLFRKSQTLKVNDLCFMILIQSSLELSCSHADPERLIAVVSEAVAYLKNSISLPILSPV